ncbi:tyrosine-type recombinase/integrase [Fundidesulfovibrio soli]|uniref:tyrosine-type recombinase/integrase n=1 Tax=Fundidesulfovibrio soli TaxID=2922716 RepID=UPI001FAFC222|nr:tyrosine-type recombinase/integrase [Fundidesulfovibrio soli]
MPIRRKDRKGQIYWYGKITLSTGKRVEKRCESKREAQEWEVLARSRAENFKETDTISLAYLAERHLDHVKTRLSSKSYEEKCRIFRRLFRTIPATTLVSKVTYGRMETFLDQISKEKSGHRANKYRVHLVRAYNWGIRAVGLPSPNPWLVERYKEVKSPRYVPTEEDFWNVYNHASDDEKRILLMFLHSAGRMQEVYTLKWEDVDVENLRFRLWTNKRKGGREFDWIPMTDDLLVTMRTQRLKTGFHEYVFINPRSGTNYKCHDHLMKRLCETAGVKRFGFHAIRHLSASILDNAGVPLSAIQAILRHKSSHTTARYLHSLTGTKVALNEAFGKSKTRANVTPMKKAQEVAAS